MTPKHNTRIVALIERAERETPFCECGAPMAVVARNGEIWLRCTAGQNQSVGSLRRLLAALASVGHTRKQLVASV